MQELHFDIVVVGGSLGGVAAALRASALGARVCLLEASSWIGGQYSSQGLTRGDETEWVNKGIGCTASYQQFRAEAVAYYTKNFALSESVRLQLRSEFFNAANHAQFTYAGGSLASSIAAPSRGSSQPVIQYVDASQFGRVTARDPRVVQFAAKLVW